MPGRLVGWLAAVMVLSVSARAQEGSPPASHSRSPLTTASPRHAAPLPAHLFAAGGRTELGAGPTAAPPGAALAGEQGVRPSESTLDASRAPLPLAPPRETASGASAPGRRPSLGGAAASVFGSLALVLGLFFLLAWFTRRAQPGSSAPLPGDVVRVLGRAPLGGRQQMHLVRFGGKLLLVSLTPAGAETLSEISDADEVARLSGLCQQHQPGSVTFSFRQVLRQLGGEPTPRGFLSHDDPSSLELANRKARSVEP